MGMLQRERERERVCVCVRKRVRESGEGGRKVFILMYIYVYVRMYTGNYLCVHKYMNGGDRGVMVIVVGIGHGDASSNPGRD